MCNETLIRKMYISHSTNILIQKFCKMKLTFKNLTLILIGLCVLAFIIFSLYDSYIESAPSYGNYHMFQAVSRKNTEATQFKHDRVKYEKPFSIKETVLKYMNNSVDPCDDFYEYACGNYHKHPTVDLEAPKYDVFTMLEEKSVNFFSKILKSTDDFYDDNQSIALQKATQFYRACMFVHQALPAVNDSLNNLLKKAKSKSSNLLLEDLLTKTHLRGYDTLFKTTVDVSIENTSTYQIMLHIPQPNISLTLGAASLYETNRYQEAYERYILSVSSKIGSSANMFVTYIKQMWSFERELAALYSQFYSSVGDFEFVKYPQFLNKTKSGAIDYSLYFKQMFKRYLRDTEKLAISGTHYFEVLGELLFKTPKRVLAVYVNWQTTILSVSHLPAIRKYLYFASSELSLAVKNKRLDPYVLPHTRECVRQTDDAFRYLLSAIYGKESLSSTGKLVKIRDIVRRMKKSVQQYFNISSHTWFHRGALHIAQVKARYLDVCEECLDFTESSNTMDSFYQELKVTEDNPLINYLNLMKWKKKIVLSTLLNHTPDKKIWRVSSMEVKPKYHLSRNKLTIPVGLLQSPLFSTDRPSALNYGAVGYLFGHEMAHAFDYIGRDFWKSGNYNPNYGYGWWDHETTTSFARQRRCLITHLRKYKSKGYPVNGFVLFNENMADFGGIRFAYSAYEEWKQTIPNLYNSEQTDLLDLNMTNQQLFFLAFAQTQCSHYREEYKPIQTKDKPGYTKYRVMVTLSNFAEFSAAFNCPKKSEMNQISTCKVW